MSNDYSHSADLDYSHSESSDGKVTTGTYRVVLPDGRTQIVNYRADSYGYVADVIYKYLPRIQTCLLQRTLLFCLLVFFTIAIAPILL